MRETYDSVIDRIGAFNAATEKLSKGRVNELLFDVGGHPGLGLRLVKTAESYAIEVIGAPASARETLAGLRFVPQGEAYVREVRRSERSWNVASELEDILQDALSLGNDVAVSVDIE